MIMKCLNIIVYYDNPDEVYNYIEEINKNQEKLVDIAIVVNKNSKHQLENTKKLWRKMGYENIYIYDYKLNIGYLNALLFITREICLNQYKFIILSNTDIHYCSNCFFENLLEKNYKKFVGCIAPNVYSLKSKSYSNPHYKKRISKYHYKKLSKIFSKPILAKMYLNMSEIKTRIKRQKEQTDSCYVYSPHGCYMIFTLEFIKKLRGLEYGVKMYSEEAFVGEMLEKNSLKCFYDSSLKIEHNESSVTGKINYKNRFQMWKESIDYILKIFYS